MKAILDATAVTNIDVISPLIQNNGFLLRITFNQPHHAWRSFDFKHRAQGFVQSGSHVPTHFASNCK